MQWKSSDASSLLFNATYLCRLQFPLVWLYLMSLDWKMEADEQADHKAAPFQVTAFQQVVKMSTTSFLGADGLNIVASLLVIIYALVSYHGSSDFFDGLDLEEKVSAGIELIQQHLTGREVNQRQLGDVRDSSL